MIALTLQELYKDNPDQLKTDFEQASEKGENLGRKIKLAIEEYANTGFSILDHRSKEKPGYIENIEYVIEDILSDKTWNLWLVNYANQMRGFILIYLFFAALNPCVLN